MLLFFFLLLRRSPRSTLFPYTTLFRSVGKSSLINAMFGTYLAETSAVEVGTVEHDIFQYKKNEKVIFEIIDRKSTRLNSSHVAISYAVFCLKKKKKKNKKEKI